MSTKSRVPGTTKIAPWSEAGLHIAQLETGTWIKFRYPDLGMLAAAGKIPDDLKLIASLRIAKTLKLLIEPEPESNEPPSIDDEKLGENGRLNAWLITQMVQYMAAEDAGLSPEGVPTDWERVQLESEDVLDPDVVPPEDVELLVALAERLRDTDARGVVMGVVPVSHGARFRHAHGCKPDCKGCAQLRGRDRLLRGLAADVLDALPVRGA